MQLDRSRAESQHPPGRIHTHNRDSSAVWIVSRSRCVVAKRTTAAHAQGGGFGRMYEGLADSLRVQLERTDEQDAAGTGILKASAERR